MKRIIRLLVGSALVLVFGQAQNSLAADVKFDIGLVAASYYGQYDPGKNSTGDSIGGYMDSWSEFVLTAQGSKGPISGNFKIKSRTENGQRSETSDMFRVAAKTLTYTGMDGRLGVDIGTVTTAAPLNYMNGLIAGILPVQDGGNGIFLSSSDGLKIEYFAAKEKGKIIRLRAASYTCNTVRHPTCGTPGSYYLSGPNATDKTISDGKAQTPGSASALSAFAVIGPLQVKLAQTSGVHDEHTADFETLSDSKTYAGIKYAITKGIGLYIGMNTAKIELASDKEALYSDLPVTLTWSGLGPGKLTATYNNLATSLDGDGYSQAIKDANDVETVYNNLVYTLPLANSVGVQLVYNTSTRTPKEGDANSQSFIGGGLYGKF